MDDTPAERLKRLPRREEDRWQGGLVRMPGWADEPGGESYRPHSSLWASQLARQIHMGELVKPHEMSHERALADLLHFATTPELTGYRRGRWR